MIGLRWVDEVGWANASQDVQGFDDTCLRWNSFKWKILGNLTFLGITLRAKVAIPQSYHRYSAYQAHLPKPRPYLF